MIQELNLLVSDFVELCTSSPTESGQIDEEKQSTTNINFKVLARKKNFDINLQNLL